MGWVIGLGSAVLGLAIALVALLGVGGMVALVVVGARRRAASEAALVEALGAMGLRRDAGDTFKLTGDVDGFAVTYEHAVYHSRFQGVAPASRVRVTGVPSALDTALVDRTWDVLDATRPTGMRVVPTGEASLDDRFDAFVTDDRSLALWRAAAADALVGGVLREDGAIWIREATLFAGQLTLVSAQRDDTDSQCRLVRAAVALARLAG